MDGSGLGDWFLKKLNQNIKEYPVAKDPAENQIKSKCRVRGVLWKGIKAPCSMINISLLRMISIDKFVQVLSAHIGKTGFGT